MLEFSCSKSRRHRLLARQRDSYNLSALSFPPPVGLVPLVDLRIVLHLEHQRLFLRVFKPSRPKPIRVGKQLQPVRFAVLQAERARADLRSFAHPGLLHQQDCTLGCRQVEPVNQGATRRARFLQEKPRLLAQSVRVAAGISRRRRRRWWERWWRHPLSPKRQVKLVARLALHCSPDALAHRSCLLANPPRLFIAAPDHNRGLLGPQHLLAKVCQHRCVKVLGLDVQAA